MLIPTRTPTLQRFPNLNPVILAVAYHLSKLILLFFKLKNRFGLASSQSISGVQSPCSRNVSRMLGALVSRLRPAHGDILPSALDVEWVGLFWLLKTDSVGLERGAQGPPRRRMMLESTEVCFCSEKDLVDLLRTCWKSDVGRDDVGRDGVGWSDVGREGECEWDRDCGIWRAWGFGRGGWSFSMSISDFASSKSSSITVLSLPDASSAEEVGRESRSSTPANCGGLE
jgi:hypothetical protein